MVTKTQGEPPRTFRTIRKENCEFDVKIGVRTRLESLTSDIPERFYSPIIYQFHQTITGNCQSPFIVSRCVVKESKNNTLIKISGDKGDIVLSRKKNTEEISGVSRIKIQESSFNHQKSSFFLEFYYFKHNDLNTPVLIKRSPDFFVYSRKPKKKSPKPTNNKKGQTILGKRSRTDHAHESIQNHHHHPHHRHHQSNQSNTGNVFIPPPPPPETIPRRGQSVISGGGQPVIAQKIALIQPPLKKRKYTHFNVDGYNIGSQKIDLRFSEKLNDLLIFVETLPIQRKRTCLAKSLSTLVSKYQETLVVN